MALTEDQRKQRRKQLDANIVCFRPPPYLREKLEKYASNKGSKNEILIDALAAYLKDKHIPA